MRVWEKSSGLNLFVLFRLEMKLFGEHSAKFLEDEWQTDTRVILPRRNPPWHDEGTYLTKRFNPVDQQEELVGAMLLHSSRTSRTNRSS